MDPYIDMGKRMHNAHMAFRGHIADQLDTTHDETEHIARYYERWGLVKYQYAVGQFTFPHGMFADPETMIRALHFNLDGSRKR